MLGEGCDSRAANALSLVPVVITHGSPPTKSTVLGLMGLQVKCSGIPCRDSWGREEVTMSSTYSRNSLICLVVVAFSINLPCHPASPPIYLKFSFLYGPTLSSIHDYWKNHSFDYMDVGVGPLRKLSTEELMSSNCGVGEDS